MVLLVARYVIENFVYLRNSHREKLTEYDVEWRQDQISSRQNRSAPPTGQFNARRL